MPTSPTPDWEVIEAAKLIQSYEEKYGVLIAPGLRSHIAAALRELDRAAEEREYNRLDAAICAGMADAVAHLNLCRDLDPFQSREFIAADRTATRWVHALDIIRSLKSTRGGGNG
jgi:hypothetical protein